MSGEKIKAKTNIYEMSVFSSLSAKLFFMQQIPSVRVCV